MQANWLAVVEPSIRKIYESVNSDITGAMTPADQANNEPSPCHDLLTFLDQPARVLLTPTFGFWKRSIASSVRR